MAAGFKLPNDHCQGDSQSQRRAEFETVVLVKLQLGQKVNGGNAKKGARCKGQGAPDPLVVAIGHRMKAHHEKGDPQRNDQGKGRIDQMTLPTRPASRGHQGSNGPGIKRLVKHYD